VFHTSLPARRSFSSHLSFFGPLAASFLPCSILGRIPCFFRSPLAARFLFRSMHSRIYSLAKLAAGLCLAKLDVRQIQTEES
jgi:hypothetical protein